MTDDQLRDTLEARVAAVNARIADACRRAGRDRGDVTLVAVTKTVSERVAFLAELHRSKSQVSRLKISKP